MQIIEQQKKIAHTEECKKDGEHKCEFCKEESENVRYFNRLGQSEQLKLRKRFALHIEYIKGVMPGWQEEPLENWLEITPLHILKAMVNFKTEEDIENSIKLLGTIK